MNDGFSVFIRIKDKTDFENLNLLNKNIHLQFLHLVTVISRCIILYTDLAQYFVTVFMRLKNVCDINYEVQKTTFF